MLEKKKPSPIAHWTSRKLTILGFATAALAIAGCGSSSLTSTPTGGATGSAFVVGTDAPLDSITSFSAQIMSVTAKDSSGNSVSLVSGTPTVDFARFNGLQTLLDMNDVPEGTYNNVTITLASTGSIGYLDTSGAKPAMQTMMAAISPASTTVTLSKPLVVAHASAPVGLRVDFDLRKSIQLDTSGNVTGAVIPTFNVNVAGVGDSDAYIDEFVAGVVSVSASGQSFVVQGPHGQSFTINVNGQTEWDNNDSISSLTTSSIVQVSGQLDKADETLDADEVAILSQNGFYASGQVTNVTPATGAATSFDLYVRALLPTNTGLKLGQIATVDLLGSENFLIYRMHNPLTQFLFNSSAMVAGQAVAVGGPASGAANGSAVTVKRVSLRNWGFNGTVVPGSVNGSQSTFQMHVNGFAGLLIPETVTVYVCNITNFRDGLNTLSDVGGSANVRVVGLLVKNPTTGQVVLLARYVDELN